MTLRQHKIRAPRKPRGEDLSVTVANQDKQIKLLIDRCATLERDNRNAESMKDHAHQSAMEWQKRYQDVQDEITGYRLTYEAMTEAANRMRGWQDCAREIISPLFPNAPGV